MGLCGEKAIDRMTASDGNSSYRNYIIDAISILELMSLKEVQGMRFDKALCFMLTDRAFAKNETLYEQVNSAIKGGITMLQLREKELSRLNFKKTEKIKPLCPGRMIFLL